jgi:magnesium chelatase family protein
MIGPPGAGKTMLAKSIVSILPPLSKMEALETSKIYSVSGKMSNNTPLLSQRPFRQPHHTLSAIAMIGGGSFPQPGEISLAHNGVLFLDELPEFNRSVIEVLRQPMEEGIVAIARAKMSIQFPARFMLMASMNPCPCGFYNHPQKECLCSPSSIQKYMHKISGPLLDRIDLHIEVTPVLYDELRGSELIDSSAIIAERVKKARVIQADRFKKEEGVYTNAQMNSSQLKKYCVLSDSAETLLKNAMVKFQLSARAFDRILKVSRSIADLEESDSIQISHLSEAIQYRNLDRSNWGQYKE